MLKQNREKGTIQYGETTFQTLYREEEVLKEISKVGQEINAYYVNLLQEYPQERVIVVCVLKGGFMFTSDLVKNLHFPLSLEFLKVKSYKGTERGELHFQTPVKKEVFNGAHVLVCDDICDSGKTLEGLKDALLKIGGAKDVQTAVMVRRSDKEQAIEPTYCALKTNSFIIGYGLDHNQLARQHPAIYHKQ